MSGWFKIDRKLFESAIWRPDEFGEDIKPVPYDMRSAWIELIGMANHKDRKTVIGRKTLMVRRGQRFTSVRKLAKRWSWDKQKVRDYLDMLEDLNMITKKHTHNGTLITIVNYRVYQAKSTNSKDTNEYTDEDTLEYSDEYTDIDSDEYTSEYANEDMNSTQTRIYKNNKNVEEDIYTASPDEDFEDEDEDEDDGEGWVIPQKDEKGHWIDPPEWNEG